MFTESHMFYRQVCCLGSCLSVTYRSSPRVNPLTGTLKPQSNGPLYSDTVIGTWAVDGWAVTFGTARRGLDGLRRRPVPTRCAKCNSRPINGQCTNFMLFDVASLHPKGLNQLKKRQRTWLAGGGGRRGKCATSCKKGGRIVREGKLSRENVRIPFCTTSAGID